MRRLNLIFTIVLLCAIFFIGPPACYEQTYDPGTQPKPVEVDYLAIVHSAILGATGIMQTSQAQAITNGNYVACVATGSAVTALNVAADGVWSAHEGTYLIPEVSLTLGVCETVENQLPETSVPPVVSLYIAAGLNSVESLLGVSKPTIQAANCMAYVWLEASLNYLQGALDPVVAFIEDPSTATVIPAVPVDHEQCAEPEPDAPVE